MRPSEPNQRVVLLPALREVAYGLTLATIVAVASATWGLIHDHDATGLIIPLVSGIFAATAWYLYRRALKETP